MLSAPAHIPAITVVNFGEGLADPDLIRGAGIQILAANKAGSSVWAATNGQLDDVPVGEVGRFEIEFRRFLQAQNRELMETIEKDKAISDDSSATLRSAVEAFKKTVSF